MAFRDIKPAAQHHIQLIPKRHIGELDNVASNSSLLSCASDITLS